MMTPDQERAALAACEALRTTVTMRLPPPEVMACVEYLPAALATVAAQRGALALALPFLDDVAAEDTSYGTICSEDPRDFSPDPECSTDAERAAHAAACEAWDRGENPPTPPTHRPIDPGRPLREQMEEAGADTAVVGHHMTVHSFGLGVTTLRRPEAEAARDAVRAALGGAPYVHPEVSRLTAALEEAVRKRERMAGELTEANEKAAKVRAELALVRTPRDGVWRWMGDGSDHPESLSCPVVMSADAARAMARSLDEARAGEAAMREALERLNTLYLDDFDVDPAPPTPPWLAAALSGATGRAWAEERRALLDVEKAADALDLSVELTTTRGEYRIPATHEQCVALGQALAALAKVRP